MLETANLEHFEPKSEDNLEQEPATESTSSPEAELPPEAQGEVNGGPLGCCLGVMVGLVVSLAIAIFSRLYADPLSQVLQGNLSLVVRILMVVVAIAAAIFFGYCGWKLGRRFYREYEPPVVKERRRRSKPKAARM